MFVGLLSDWTDPAGAEHPAGAVVELDAVTAAELVTAGVAEYAAPSESAGPTSAAPPSAPPEEPDGWIGPARYAQDDTVVVRDENTGTDGSTTGNGRA